MEPRVTADTNIYISALNFGGMAERFLRLAEQKSIQLVTSDAIMQEIADTLRGKKFNWPEEEIDKAMRQLDRIIERVTPTQTLDVIKTDPSDNRILECADAGEVDYIVTGDKKHILPLRSHGNARIVKLGDFMKQMQGETGQQR